MDASSAPDFIQLGPLDSTDPGLYQTAAFRPAPCAIGQQQSLRSKVNGTIAIAPVLFPFECNGLRKRLPVILTHCQCQGSSSSGKISCPLSAIVFRNRIPHCIELSVICPLHAQRTVGRGKPGRLTSRPIISVIHGKHFILTPQLRSGPAPDYPVLQLNRPRFLDRKSVV